MRPSVRDYFLPFTKPLEGVVRWMYPDVKNYVSIAIGNEIDPVSLARALPFVHFDGTPASEEEIIAEWQVIKHLPPDEHGREARLLGHLYAMKFAKLRLTDEGVTNLVTSKLHQNEAYLKTQFRDFEEWPADAQLGVLSMAWANGAAFQHGWPNFTHALIEQDWLTASIECYMPEADHALHGNPAITGLRARNDANKTLFRNALFVVKSGMLGPALDYDTLYFPQALSDEIPEPAPTVPAMAVVHPMVTLSELDDPDDES